MSGAVNPATPEEELNGYLESPGHLKPEHEWRAVVEYRCKRSHLLGAVIKLRERYVLYTVRREDAWSSPPTDMLFVIPAVDDVSQSFAVSVGGCKCQPARTRELGSIWNDINSNRGRRNASRVTA